MGIYVPGVLAPVASAPAAAILAALVSAGFPPALAAQAKEEARTLVEGGGGSSTVRAKKPHPQVSFESFVKLSPVREWTNRGGNVIEAELLSWPVADPDATEKPVDALVFTIVKDGKVRLRKGGKTYVLPLSSLADADQRFIGELRAYHAGRKKNQEGEKAGEAGAAGKESPDGSPAGSEGGHDSP
jgi:hypothetical protein